jgi:hypothetical protein
MRTGKTGKGVFLCVPDIWKEKKLDVNVVFNQRLFSAQSMYRNVDVVVYYM